MVVLVSVALLVLAAAIVLLYAMMGELAARVPPAAEDEREQVAPLPDYRSGAVASSWPESLAGLSERPSATLLVLSSVCSSCREVAAELSGKTADELNSYGLVISSSDANTAREFVAAEGVGHLPHLIDEGGQWVQENFGVNMSPSALLLEEGVLIKGYTFGKFEALRRETAKRERKEIQDGQLQG